MRQAWLFAGYGDKRRELKHLYKNLTKQRFWRAILRILGLVIIPVWLEALTVPVLIATIVALTGGIVMPVLWFSPLYINWVALSNLSHGLRFSWDAVAKEVESAVPQLQGLVDE